MNISASKRDLNLDGAVMNKSCPFCLNDLMEIDCKNILQIKYLCSHCLDAETISKFHVSYSRNNNEIFNFILYLDKYCIKNYHDKNRTVIAAKDYSAQSLSEIKYKDILFLPLIRFELDSLDSIKKKLNLLLLTV